MSRIDSPLLNRMLFVVGSRRSGTHWLQRIVGAHPSVSMVPAETHLISHGIAPLLERFHHAARSSPQVGAIYADRGMLLDAVRGLCDVAFGEFLEPGTEMVVERTPLHAFHVALIEEIYPDARVLHIIRDGRDAARSIAAQSWGPDDLAGAATEWRDSVAAARAAGAGSPGYREVRYETLLTEPEDTVAGLYSWLELEADDAAVAEALAEARRAANLDPTGDGRVATEKWRQELSREQIDVIEGVAGKLLEELGYPLVASDRSGARRGAGDSDADNAGSGHPEKLSPLDRQYLVDQAVSGIHAGDAEALAQLATPDLLVTVVDAAERRQARGKRGIELLAKTLASDPAYRGRQLLGEPHVAIPTTAVVLSYELDGGRRADRLLLLTVERGRLAELALYRFEGATL